MWRVISFIIRASWETRCKSALSRTKIRLEVIKRKRNAMLTLLKEDIAHLLESNLQCDAYAKAEELYAELILSSCYEYVEQCCSLVMEHVKQMHKQSECPDECKVGVASLIDATPSFGDLPELRDLRLQFYNKYSIALESYANKEFIDKLKPKPPTIKEKLELLHDIAKEFSVIWDPKSLEEQLQNPTMSTNDNDGDDNDKIRTSQSTSSDTDENKDTEDENESEQNNETMAGPKLRHSRSWCAPNDDKQRDENDNSLSTSQNQVDQSSEKPKPTSLKITKHLKPSQSCVVSSETSGFDFMDVKETMFGLPLPPGRRRYMSLDGNDESNNAKSEQLCAHGKSKFIPPDYEEQRRNRSRHKRSISYGNDGSFGFGNGKFPDIAELAERVAAHRKTQG